MTPMTTSTRRAFVTVALLLALAGSSAASIAAGGAPAASPAAAANRCDRLAPYFQQLAHLVVPNKDSRSCTPIMTTCSHSALRRRPRPFPRSMD